MRNALNPATAILMTQHGFQLETSLFISYETEIEFELMLLHHNRSRAADGYTTTNIFALFNLASINHVN